MTAPTDKRTSRIVLYVTPAERERLDRKALDECRRLSDWCRLMVLRAAGMEGKP